MTKKKLAILGTVGVPSNYGGFETLVENLLDILPSFFEVSVYCESKSYPEKLDNYKGAKLIYINIEANGFQSILYDAISLVKSFRNQDYILLLGVSGTFILPIIKPFMRAKLVTHIDGLEWKRDKWGWLTKKFLKFSETLAIKFSDRVIADNKYIQEYISHEYGKESVFIPYGSDHVKKVDFKGFKKKFSFLGKPYFFTVCRIEPENNIELQLKAFKLSNVTMPYVVVGNWNANDYGIRLYKEYSSVDNIILCNPIYDPEELNAIRSNSMYYLHGHSAGGTNPSLVEAMYLGLPVIAYGVNYNRETTFGQAIYYMSQDELLEILNSLEKIERENISKNLQKLAKENYSWLGVSKKYVSLFNNLDEKNVSCLYEHRMFTKEI